MSQDVHITFFVEGLPRAQPRQRQTKNGANYTPGNHPVFEWRAAVRRACREAYTGAPLEGPVSLHIVFYLPRTKAQQWKTRPHLRDWHSKKPDFDNLMKAVADVLNGVAWRDDAQVASVTFMKMICGQGDVCGAQITIANLSLP